MDNKKLAKVEGEIAKTRSKIADLQGQLKELERQRTELENSNIVEMVRGLSISLADLPALLHSLSAATSGQIGPKYGSQKTEEKEDATSE